MITTKHLKPFLANTSIKPILQKALVTKTHIVATDSFKLIEIDRSTLKDDTTDYNLSLPTVSIEEASEYPSYKNIMPNVSNDTEYQKVTVGADFLAEVIKSLQAIQKDNAESKQHARHIEIYFNKVSHQKPLVFKIKQATALLMPIMK